MVDDARFTRVYAEHASAVMRYCAFSLGSQAAAEDVAAEVFARFIERGERVAEAHVQAWLIRVARNLCADHYRAAARASDLAARLAASPPRADAWSDGDAWAALRVLTERERLAVYLRIVEDLPFAEVGRLMGRREAAAKMIYYRAVRRLRGHHSGRVGEATVAEGSAS